MENKTISPMVDADTVVLTDSGYMPVGTLTPNHKILTEKGFISITEHKKPKEKIIIISPEGEIKTIYSDDLQEMGLGAVSVKRASNVEFDEDSQKWRIVDAETDSLIGVGFNKRSDAIDYEVEFLNERLAVCGK